MRDDRVEEEVGVIDVGGDTTDFAVMVSTSKGHSIDPSRSSGIRLGVLHAVDELRSLMSAELGETIPPGPAREVLAKGYTKIRGKEYRCPKLVAKARQSMSERIKRELGRRWRGREHTLTMSRILVVGGGANLLDRAELEKTYPQAMWPEDPQFANARGMLNYLVNVELRSVYRPWSST
jgi:plasmid segregation protein ParM